MKTTYWILIIIGAFLNGFVTHYVVDDFENEKNKRKIIAITLCFLFGWVILIIAFIADWVWEKLQLLDDSYNIRFYWRWYFTSRYDNLSEEKLRNINENAKTYAGQKLNRLEAWGKKDERWFTVARKIRKKYPRDFFNWMDNPENFIVKNHPTKKNSKIK